EPPRMDPWRLTTVRPGSSEPWERGPMFTNFNLNKREVVLDLATARGKEIFLALLRETDAVIENFSPRVMPNLGLEYEMLRQVKPDIIMASISGYGATGPWRDYTAHGIGFEQA